MQNLNIRITEFGEAFAGQLNKLFMPLDGVNLGDQPGKNGCAVSRAGSNFEGSIAWAWCRTLDHQRDDVGLRDRLSSFDREGCIEISELREVRRDKKLPWNIAHSFEHRRITNSASGNLMANHLQSRLR